MTVDYAVLDKGAHGYTSTIYYLGGQPPRVCKAFEGQYARRQYPAEKTAYERFNRHTPPSSILRYYGAHEDIADGIVLEFAEECDVLNFVRRYQQATHNSSFAVATLLRWADQAAEALEYAHSLGVMNSDVHCVNFFLDRNFDLKVGDWAGASIDGSTPWSMYRQKYSLVDPNGAGVRDLGVSARTEIFALGTALYYIVTGQEPWVDLQDPADRLEIERHIRDKEFPNTNELPLGDIVSGCWSGLFGTMTEVREALQALKGALQSQHGTEPPLTMASIR